MPGVGVRDVDGVGVRDLDGPSPMSTEEPDGKKPNIPAIVGGTLGGVGVIAGGAAAYRHRKNKKAQANQAGAEGGAAPDAAASTAADRDTRGVIGSPSPTTATITFIPTL